MLTMLTILRRGERSTRCNVRGRIVESDERSSGEDHNFVRLPHQVLQGPGKGIG